MECKHDSYEVKQIMDMKFCVCKCGFQWKGDKPYSNRLQPIAEKREEVNMPCYNCTPIPRHGCHTVKAVIEKGVVYCIDCGKDVTHELNAIFDPVCRKCGDPLTTCELVCENCRIA